MSRKHKSIMIALIILVGAAALAMGMASLKKAPARKMPEISKPNVSTLSVVNGQIQLKVPVYGTITPVRKIDLYSEVSGVMESTGKSFLEGVAFAEGETLIKINSDEAKMNLRSQKSAFLSDLASLLTELKFDFPESYGTWQAFVDQFDIETPLPNLPVSDNQKEKIYIASRGIYDTYYTIKKDEVVLNKYELKAPYDGVIIESNIKPGMLVSNGQKLGSYMDDSAFDLETFVKLSELPNVHVGDVATVTAQNTNAAYTGTVTRISEAVDNSTQTVNVYVRLSGVGLKDNMFLSGNIVSTIPFYGMEIPRKLLVDENYVYIVDDEQVIRKMAVTVYQKISDKAVVGGLPDGTRISERTQGVYDGLVVNADGAENDPAINPGQNAEMTM